MSAPEPSSVQIRLTSQDFQEGRYHRLEQIPWWEQERLQAARLLVAGAGALGNEVLKNLALLGVGWIVVADFDAIETSNLSRATLFRQDDVGQEKALLGAQRVMELNPDCRAVPFSGDLRTDLGGGLLRRVDLVLGCLDNIEARLALNRCCYAFSVPYFDAALDTLNGDVRLFASDGDGPCYECTLSQQARDAARQRRSCLNFTRAQSEAGHIPTAPTIAAIVAGLQTQYAVRYLHGLSLPLGQRIGLYGLSDHFFSIALRRNEACPTHAYCDRLASDDIQPLPLGARDSLQDLLGAIRQELGPEAIIDLDGDRDLLSDLHCPACGFSSPQWGVMGTIDEEQARCPHCRELRRPTLHTTLDGSEPFAHLPLRDTGIPPLHVLYACNPQKGLDRYFELTADETEVLGKQWPSSPSP